MVDLSRVAPVIHQNHDYNHVAGGADRVWRGEEAESNLRLYDAAPHSYTFLDVTHEVTFNGAIRRVWLRKPLFRARTLLWDVLVRRTASLRRALNLRRKSAQTRPSS